MGRRLLLLIALTVGSSIAVVLLAGGGLFQVQRAMESVARSYVRNLAESVASRLETGSSGGFYSPRQLPILGMRMWLSSSTPGTVAVLDDRGNYLFGSPGAEVLTPLARQLAPSDQPIELRDLRGERYTVASVRTSDGAFLVVAAVSWRSLLGPVVRYATFWPFGVGLVGLFGLTALAVLIRRVIAPLVELTREVDGLRWGEEIPRSPDGSAVRELERLRSALVALAHTAADRAALNRRYVDDLVRVQEEERSGFSREIHDGPLQAVTALLQRLHLARRAGDARAAAREMEAAESIAASCVRELRAICDGLAPPWLELGLWEALAELTDRLSSQTGAQVLLEGEDPGALPPEQVLALFRVVQEAVHNAVRHGGAREVLVRLERAETPEPRVLMDVVDDGGGFDPPADYTRLRVEGHRGLANMAERMALVGGSIRVRSRPGAGTTIRCAVPLTVRPGDGNRDVPMGTKDEGREPDPGR
jgi:signal transduction histidine kinase